MKKHELLKKAYDNYPKGSKFINLGSGNICETSGKFYVDNYGVKDSENHYFVYGSGKWAEIVKPKIAVKVENEKEFKALMKYYDSIGYIGSGKSSTIYNPSHKAVEFKDGYTKFNPKYYHSKQDYQIIQFSEFASEHGIKLPLLTSKDGVDLYEGNLYFQAYFDTDLKWKFNDIYKGTGSMLQSDHNVVVNTEKNKAFSTKQSALDWIEAQKPKEIQYVSEFGIKCQITKQETILNCGCGCFSITKKDIEEINKAIKELEK